jgi:hypothetical protein
MAAGMYAQKNPDSGIAKNMDMIMMLSMLTMLLPMLNSPLKLLAATAVGLVAVFKMQAATIKKNIIEGQKQASSMTMTTKQLEELGKITKQVSITQTAAAKRAGRNTDIVPVSMEFGNNLIANSDFGKNLKSSFEKSLATFGSGTAVDSLVNQLGTAVSQGVLDRGQAESIAVALTRNLKDAKLELDVRGRLIQLLGPNGENLVNSPLQVQVDLITTGQNLQKAALKNLNLVASQQKGINTKAEIGQLGAGAVGGGILGARAGIQAANMVQGGIGATSLLSQEAALARAGGAGKLGSVMKAAKAARVAGTIGSGAVGATGVGAPAALVGVAVSTVIFGGIETAIRQWQKGKEKAAIGQAAGMLQGIVSENIAASQASIDALTSQYDSAIANLELKKQTLKTEQERKAVDDQIAQLESKKQSGLKTLRSKQAELLGSASSNYDKVSKRSLGESLSPFGSGRGQVRDKYMEAFSVGMQDKFKDNAPLKAQASVLQSQLDKIGKDKVTLEISTLVTSDVLTPNEASTLVSTLTRSGGDIQKNLQALVSVQGTEGVQRLSTILTLLPNENNQKQLVLAVKNMDKAEADATLSAIEELGKIPDYIGIDINIETQKNDIEDLKARGKEVDALRKKFPNGQLSLEALVKMQEEAGGPNKNLTLDAAITQWTAISKLPKELQFQAMITIGSITESDSFEKIIDRELTTMFAKKYPKAKGRLAATALNNFKKDPDNIAAAQSAYFEKVAPQLFGTANVDSSKKGGPTSTTGEGTKRDESFLSDLAQRLKLVKEGGFNALTPLVSLRKFLDDGGKKSINPGLDNQRGAIKQIETAAKAAGISIDKDFMEIIRGLDAEQFKLWSDTLFNIQKNGRITGLKDDFIVINEGFRKATIGGYIQDVKDASKEIENQVAAHELLTKEGYNSLEIQKILQDATLTAKIAAQGGLKATKEEQAELNKEIQKTIDLNYRLAKIKLSEDMADTQAQIDAFKKLNDAGIKHETIIELIKNKSYAWAIANSVGDVSLQFEDLIKKTEAYAAMLKVLENATKTFEQKTQDGIDANVQALDLQARKLQNEFDLENFELKAKIKLAEDAVEQVNNDIQSQQDKIDDINFTLKYDPAIGQNLVDDLQEQISDLQRNIDLTFDRPIQELSDRSNILSNDLTLIDKAAESINEKYDAQEKALQTISELNQDIANQEKSRISLADALSQGDISAAAQMANDMRSTAADSANRTSGELLTAARKSEIDGLVSASGMTKIQIETEQFAIAQRTYVLEQQRKIAQQAIVEIEDRIYNITELREAKLLLIRDVEQVIDGLKNNQLRSAQANLDVLQKELDKNQEILDAALLKIERQKLEWESVQLQLDSYKGKLIEANGELRTMLDIVNAIAAAFARIKMPQLTGGSSGGYTYDPKASADANKEAEDAAKAAADAAAEAAAANDAATAAALAAADAIAAAEAEAAKIAASLAATKSNLSPKAQKILSDAAKAEAERLAALEKQNAQWAAKVAAMNAAAAKSASVGSGGGAGMLAMSSGGMVPKYMAMGGKIGSDTVPAMLTPGEFVMNKGATKAFGPMLATMNGSKFPSMLKGGLVTPIYQTSSNNIMAPSNMSTSSSVNNNSSSVYNYNVGINVSGSNLNPQDIARAVMTQIKGVDSQRIRTQR